MLKLEKENAALKESKQREKDLTAQLEEARENVRLRNSNFLSTEMYLQNSEMTSGMIIVKML